MLSSHARATPAWLQILAFACHQDVTLGRCLHLPQPWLPSLRNGTSVLSDRMAERSLWDAPVMGHCVFIGCLGRQTEEGFCSLGHLSDWQGHGHLKGKGGRDFSLGLLTALCPPEMEPPEAGSLAATSPPTPTLLSYQGLSAPRSRPGQPVAPVQGRPGSPPPSFLGPELKMSCLLQHVSQSPGGGTA